MRGIILSIIFSFNIILSSSVFAFDSFSFSGEGECDMVIKDEKALLSVGGLYSGYEFVWSGSFYKESDEEDDNGEFPKRYIGLDDMKKELKEILPDATILSYKIADSETVYFNVKTKLNSGDLLANGNFNRNDEFQKGYNDEISSDLPLQFINSEEYQKCFKEAYNKALISAANNFLKQAKLQIFSNSDDCSVYKLDNNKLKINCSIAN
ncbi:hypothetical protein HDR59_02105 [bacterium]|nr:hypothetical protein [bacterium]